MDHRFNFENETPLFQMECTGNHRCTTEKYHVTGCPKLKADLVKFKEKSK